MLEATGPNAEQRGRDEVARIASVERCGVIDLGFGECFDRVLRIAARLFDVPFARITVVTAKDLYVKASLGHDPVRVPRARGLCEAVVESGDLVHHVDLQLDRDARNHPLGEGLKFYAGAPVRGSDGYVMGALCVADIHSRKLDARERLILEDLADSVADLIVQEHMKREHDENLRRLNGISEAPNLLIIELGADGTIRHASPSMKGMMGYAPSEVEGRDVLGFVHPDERAAMAKDFATAVTGGSIEGETDVMASDGGYRTLAWSTCPGATSDGTPYAVAILRDVSDRVYAQRELAEAYGHRRQLFETSRDAMVLMAAGSDQVVDANGPFCELFGYTVDELKGMNLEMLQAFTTPSEEEMKTQLADLVDRGFTDEYERVFRSKAGEEVPVSIRARLLRDGRGTPASILTKVRDIRHERARELLQSQMQEELEERVRVRTQELEETLERLQAAERLASIGTLASGVAHQINNPIGSILAACEFALMCESEDDFKETWRRALMDAVEQSKRCGRIVRSMLEYSAGTRSERWREDLALVVPRAIQIVESHTHDYGVRVSCDCGASSMPVVMNPIEMEQVLVNLIENAIQAAPTNGVVEVRAYAKGGSAHIEVTDDGVGIADNDRDRIFEPFFTTRQEEGGTGLGLSVAEGIVKNLGGEIRVEQRPQRGTCVQIVLPIDDGDSPAV